MEYKKAYKELIEKLQTAKEKSGGYTFASVIDTILPELNENEDEKWRKWLINHLKGYINQTNERYGEVCKDAIAWLEKQKGQKEIDYDEELKKCKDNPLYFYNEYVKIKLKEQKPSWSEEDEKMKSLIISTLTSMGTLNLERYYHMNLDEVKEWFKSLKPRWKPTEEQMEALTIAVHDSHEHCYYKNLYSLYNDLKSL